MSKLIEGVHFYLNNEGLVVLTEEYHLQRGYCCSNGCLHCPFNYENVGEPRRSVLLARRKSKEEEEK